MSPLNEMTDVLKEYLVLNDRAKSQSSIKKVFIPRNHLVAVIAFGFTLKFLTKFQYKFSFLVKHLNKIKAIIFFLLGASIVSFSYNLFKGLRKASKI